MQNAIEEFENMEGMLWSWKISSTVANEFKFHQDRRRCSLIMQYLKTR